MIEHIRSMYIDIFKSTKLMDDETRDFAIQKIEAMEKQVVFPNYLNNISVIEELYANVSEPVISVYCEPRFSLVKGQNVEERQERCSQSEVVQTYSTKTCNCFVSMPTKLQ